MPDFIMSSTAPLKIGRNSLCPCGSGLKYKKCCFRKNSTTTTSPVVGANTDLFSQAQAFLQNNQLQQAIKCYQDILAQNENHCDALHYLGVALHQNGESDLAMDYLTRSIELKPDDAMFRNNLGMVLEESGEVIESEKHFKMAVQIDPESIEARFNLARILVAREKSAIALPAIIRLVADQPEDLEIKQLLATAYRNNYQAPEAIGIYESILEKTPADTKTRQQLAETHAVMGQYRHAEEIYEKLCQEEPENNAYLFQRACLAEERNALDAAQQFIRILLGREQELDNKTKHSVFRLKAMLCRRSKKFNEALDWLNRVFVDRLADDEKNLYFAERSAVEDKLGLFEQAFCSYINANEARASFSAVEHSHEEILEQHGKLKQVFSMKAMESWQGLVPGSIEKGQGQPLFILGFPRSGTTLTEQILGAHPEVCFGGELPFMSQVEAKVASYLNSNEPFPDCLMALSLSKHKNVLTEIQALYLKKASQLELDNNEAHWFTDKSPFNSERLAMIHLMFPESPIIHVIRHPLDTCLSAFFTSFQRRHWYSLNLEDTAMYFKEIIGLVEHYKAQIADLKYLSVKYEDLVENPEPQVRRMLEFIGEPYDACCLDFHKSKRVARTASYAQVNQKLYKSSMYRYKHYRKQVEPILPILMPVIESLGYTVED